MGKDSSAHTIDAWFVWLSLFSLFLMKVVENIVENKIVAVLILSLNNNGEC